MSDSSSMCVCVCGDPNKTEYFNQVDPQTVYFNFKECSVCVTICVCVWLCECVRLYVCVCVTIYEWVCVCARQWLSYHMLQRCSTNVYSRQIQRPRPFHWDWQALRPRPFTSSTVCSTASDANLHNCNTSTLHSPSLHLSHPPPSLSYTSTLSMCVLSVYIYPSSSSLSLHHSISPSSSFLFFHISILLHFLHPSTFFLSISQTSYLHLLNLSVLSPFIFPPPLLLRLHFLISSPSPLHLPFLHFSSPHSSTLRLSRRGGRLMLCATLRCRKESFVFPSQLHLRSLPFSFPLFQLILFSTSPSQRGRNQTNKQKKCHCLEKRASNDLFMTLHY